VLTGPTAAGKTAWLVGHAAPRPQIVISADSRQVYLHMDIGTGKPTPSEQQMLPHCGIDCLKPGIKYSVYQFLKIAAGELADAAAEGRMVWVCGGSGLYIRALLEGLSLGSQPRPRLREALARRLEQESPREIAAALRLQLTDPDNPVRVVRAAEHACADPGRARSIYRWAKLPADAASADTAGSDAEDDWRAELERWQCAGIAVLDPGRDELARLIDRRVGAMFDAGLPDEVRRLRQLGYGEADVVREGIGYLEAGELLDGRLSLAEAVERTVIRTRQYAKRQRTYFTGQRWPVVSRDELADWAERIRDGQL
jgi:tRNA dimethylallyltransferase